MKIRTILAGISSAALLACAGASQAQDIGELLYVAPMIAVFGGSAYAPELGAGAKFRGVGNSQINLSVEASVALYQPSSVGELWVGSRLGFVLDSASQIELVGNSSIGLIGNTPSYRLGAGAEIPVLHNVDLVVEGTMAGHFGGSPTDNGIRIGIHFFPGR